MSKDRAAQLVEAGIWLKLSGDREGASKLFERALKLDPGNEKAAELLGGAPVPGEGEVEAVAESRPRRNSPVPVPGAHPFERSADPLPGDRDRELAAGVVKTPTPPPSIDSDWGRLTGAVTPVPSIPPVAPVIAPAVPTPGMFDAPQPSSKSGTMQLFSTEVSGQPPAPSSKSGTMQLFSTEISGQSPAPSSKSGTMQLFADIDLEPGPAPSSKSGTMQLFPQQPAKPSTMQLYPEQPAPRTTMPQFVAPVRTVTLGEEPLDDSPPPSTPPIFAAPPPEPATSDSGNAWTWTPGSDDREPLAPRPSPHLAPSAESAWDARTNPGIKLDEVAGRDRALDLLSSDSKITRAAADRQEELRVIIRGARDLLDLDDHTGAMELISKAQGLAPDDPQVVALRERSEKTLLTMFESKLGRLETVPRVLLKDDEIIWLNLDHRAGFVLAQIDGTVTFDDLFSVSGMSRIDTARILAQLIDEGVISRG